MAVQAVPTYLQNASHPAANFRQAQSANFTAGGILGVGELAVAQQGTPNMSVILGPGRAQVVGNSVSAPTNMSFTTQGMYTTLNDANLTLTIAASDPTNPRIDVMYVQIQDAFYTGATNTAIAGVVTGTPGVTPAVPAIPVNSIAIANIAVAANATTIVTANIAFVGTYASSVGPRCYVKNNTGYTFASSINTYQTVTGVTVTLGAGEWLVFGSASFNWSTATIATYLMSVVNTTDSIVLCSSQANGTSNAAFMTAVGAGTITVPAGTTKTVSLQVQQSSFTGTNLVPNSSLFAVQVAI